MWMCGSNIFIKGLWSGREVGSFAEKTLDVAGHAPPGGAPLARVAVRHARELVGRARAEALDASEGDAEEQRLEHHLVEARVREVGRWIRVFARHGLEHR